MVKNLDDPRYCGAPLVLPTAPRRDGSLEERAKERVGQLNVEMMGLNRKMVYESSFNQTALRFADSRESGGSSDHSYRHPV